MIAEESVHAAVIRYPILDEVLQGLDTKDRASVIQALILIVRQAQHEERRACARLALEHMHGSSESRILADWIATEILARDADA